MPNFNDDLDEIKRIVNGEGGKFPLSSEKSVSSREEPVWSDELITPERQQSRSVIPSSPQRPSTSKAGAGAATPRQGSGAFQQRQSPDIPSQWPSSGASQQRSTQGIPSEWQKSGVPQSRQSTGIPSEQQRSATAQSRQSTGIPSERQRPVTSQSRQPQDSFSERQRSGAVQTRQPQDVSSERQRSGIPQSRPTQGVPVERQRSGTPQSRQPQGTPSESQRARMPQSRQPQDTSSESQRSKMPQPRQQSGIPPVESQRNRPHTQSRPSVPSDIPDSSGKVRSYDISATGKITKSSDVEPELDIGEDNFKVKFDFDAVYKDVPEERPLRLRREKRTGCIGGILYGAFVISISLVLAMLMWMAAVDVLGFGFVDEQVNVTVPAEFAIEDVTDILYNAGIIRYKFLFNIYAGFSNAADKISAGSYVLNRNYDYRAIVQGMTARAGVRVERTVTIPEGYTMSQIFTLLEDYGVCPASDLWEAATNHDFNFSFLDKDTLGDKYRLEGFLFPETYNFYIDSTPTQALIKMLREFNSRFTEEYVRRAENMDYTIRDIIIVASMIEREAGNDEERPRIAAVIYNRLNSKDFPNLQIDATINYAIAGTGRPFSTDIDHPYNTYLHAGLPPGPISNPGMPSIRAALYPDSTNEYFYALNKEGAHNFFRTKAQHEAFVNSDEYGG